MLSTYIDSKKVENVKTKMVSSGIIHLSLCLEEENMVKVRIEKKPAFKIVGRKIWISGTDDNGVFGRFWKESHENGLIELLHKIPGNVQKTNIDSGVFGVSCVEKDPNNRSFYFYIAAECDGYPEEAGLEQYSVPACTWAVFENIGTMPDSLVESEMYAFLKWLPNSKYTHANAPEMEVYPKNDSSEEGIITEFWLPLVEKECNN
jgi:AraC family transcriptional regulator